MSDPVEHLRQVADDARGSKKLGCVEFAEFQRTFTPLVAVALLDVAAEVGALTEWVDGIRYCRVCDRWVPELADHVNDDPNGPCPVAPVLAALDRLSEETPT